MMNDESRRAACREDIDEDARLRLNIESALAAAGGISSKELQARVDKIIKICAECGITEEQIYAILAAYEPPSLEAAVRQIEEAEKALHKAIGAEAAKLMDGFGEVYRKSRRRWGVETSSEADPELYSPSGPGQSEKETRKGEREKAMTILYYKRDGKIRHYQKAPNICREQLELSVSKFNSRHEAEGISSHIFDAPEGSFEAYILDVLEERRFYTVESVRAAKDAIDQARDMIEALEPLEV